MRSPDIIMQHLPFNIIANLMQDSEKFPLLFRKEPLLQTSDTDSVILSDNLPFNVTVVFKFSYNKM